MDIHTMMANAAADIRSMEMRTEALARELKAEKEDNERLRQENAKITAARMHAEADLIHYQNVFVASVCIEAGNICKEFFNATHEKVRERAEGAIQRFVEEKVDKERSEGIVDDPNLPEHDPDLRKESEYAYSNPIDDPDNFDEFDKSITTPTIKHAEVQTTYSDSEAHFKPKSLSLRERAARLKAATNAEPIPKFLTEPKEPPATSLRGMLATVGL